ncbi:MAG: hypothetical protein CVU84_16805 [Firmicutes bacterium HGW-Firmicutes-1]|jgi:uncharacterized membrane protein required for colicin V production|nr:MAG: hypothetical protein CVU84_16805 [Firmicutes bacterium HGW-Firmicutes-1]
MSLSYLDYIFIGIIVLTAIIAFGRGLIKTIYSFFSLIIGMGVAYTLYPKVTTLLFKYTNVYASMVSKIIKALNLEKLAQNQVTPQDQLQVIDKLKVPQFLKIVLKENKNAEVYDLLKATKLEEYIGGTIATIAMNALAFLLVLILTVFILKIVSHALDIISKLPVIHQLNKVGGLAIGLVQGVVLVWILCIALSFITSIQTDDKLFLLIEKSPLVKYFYNHNLLVNFISNLTKVFT